MKRYFLLGRFMPRFIKRRLPYRIALRLGYPLRTPSMPPTIKLMADEYFLRCKTKEAEFFIHGEPYRRNPTMPRMTGGTCTLYNAPAPQEETR